MQSDDGKAISELLVKRFGLCDSRGSPHVASGLLTSIADVLVFVAYDDHEDVGRRIHFFSMPKVRGYIAKCIAWGEAPIAGSRSGVGVRNTGYGYNVAPVTLDGVDIPLTSSNQEAEDVVEERLSVTCKYRKATHQEQIVGVDFVVFDACQDEVLAAFWDGMRDLKLEVKSRGSTKAYPKIFLQVSETNPASHFSSKPILQDGGCSVCGVASGTLERATYLDAPSGGVPVHLRCLNVFFSMIVDGRR